MVLGRAGRLTPGGLRAAIARAVIEVPAEFAGKVTLTIPLATLADLADRPGEIVGIGPVDPKPEANTPNCHRTETYADQHGGSGIDVLRQRRGARPTSAAASHVLARVKVMIMAWAVPCT